VNTMEGGLIPLMIHQQSALFLCVERGCSQILMRACRDAKVALKLSFFIDNLLVRIHFIIVMIRWTGLAPTKPFRSGILGLLPCRDSWDETYLLTPAP